MMRTLLTISGINFFIMLVAVFMLVMPVQLAVIYNEPFEVTPHEVKRGDTISFTIEFKKTDNYQVESTRSIICNDGNLVTLSAPSPHTDTVKSAVSTGYHKATVEIVVPKKTSLGKCHVELNNTYIINPLRTMHRDMVTQDFTVIE